MDPTTLLIVAAIVVFAILFVKKTLVIIPQSETKIIERLGKYHSTLSPGINIIIPFIDTAKKYRHTQKRTVLQFHDNRFKRAGL